MASHRQCRPHHEDGPPRQRQNRKGGQGMHAGVRQRVHLLHHQRGLGEMPAGKAQNRQRRGHFVCHDFAGLRELLRGPEDLSLPIPRNPPRKSEQASWLRSTWGRRAQLRRPSKSGTACTERRQRNGRGQRHCLWLHGTQWERLQRVLGDAAPSPGTRRSSVCQIGRAQWRSTSSLDDRPRGRPLTSDRPTGTRCVQNNWWCFGIGGMRAECRTKEPSQFLGHLDSYLNGNIVCTIGRDDGAWNNLFQLGRKGHNTWLRYLFCSSRWITVLEVSFAHAWTKRSLCRMQYNVSESMMGVL